MSLDEFITKYNGEYVEVSGPTAPNQCVDLGNAYIREVLNLPIIEWTNAIDFPQRAGDKYDWILNTPTNIPVRGDLVIFYGVYGHISIFLEGDVNEFWSFDQNFPQGSFCTVEKHKYDQVKGWLHPKQLNKPSEENLNWDCFLLVCNTLGVQADPDNKKDSAKKAKDRINQLKSEVDSRQTTIDALNNKITAQQLALQQIARIISAAKITI